MKHFYSQKTADALLHTIADVSQVRDNRLNLTDADKLIQAAIIPVALDKTIGPHQHTHESFESKIFRTTQEAWFIYKGTILVKLFDEDKNFIHEEILTAGMILLTFCGGHYMKSIESDTIVIEFKNGPYFGRDYINFPETEELTVTHSGGN